MLIARRSFLAGMAAVAAPAVIRIPGLLMPVKPPLIIHPVVEPLPRWWWNAATRDALRQFRNVNAFLLDLDDNLEGVVRIKLPAVEWRELRPRDALNELR